MGAALPATSQLPANVFDGHFPDTENRSDGYAGTSPVEAFPANGYGLYDVGGNVWQ
jgi:formylglycine-generating enzyme required for sulfatase activity